MRKRRSKKQYESVTPKTVCMCPLKDMIDQGVNYLGKTIYWCKKHKTSRVE